MSKDAKQKKLQRQRERDFREKRLSRAYEQPKLLKPPASDSDGIILLSYNVTFEPIYEDTEAHRRLRSMESEEAMEKLNGQVHHQPQLAIPRLQSLIENHPDVPMLYNWLAVAYNNAGYAEKSDEMCRLNYKRHPDYLFAITHECLHLIDEGKLDQVSQLLDRRFDLKLMYPHRDVFHFTEVMAFDHMLVCYYVKIGELRAAEMAFSIMERLDPENKLTAVAGDLLGMAKAMEKFRSMMGSKRKKFVSAKASKLPVSANVGEMQGAE